MSDCIIWLGGYLGPNGYGRVYHGSSGKEEYAHRFFYSQDKGEIPKGYIIHHKCENRICVNTDHMELMTLQDHAKLSRTSKHTCIHGHLLTPENLRNRRDGFRECLTCHHQRQRDYKAKLKARRMEGGGE